MDGNEGSNKEVIEQELFDVPGLKPTLSTEDW